MFRRFYESLLALLCLLVFMPLVWSVRLRRRPASKVVTVYGRLGRPVTFRIERLFTGASPLRLLNYWHFLGMILLGRFAWSGPRPVKINRPRPAYTRYSVRPGLVSPFMLQSRMNIAFNDVDTTEERFIRAASARSHLGLLLRYLLSLVVGGGNRKVRDRVELLDVTLHNQSMHATLTRIWQFARGAQCRQVAFVNPDCLNIAGRDPDYKALLQSLPMVLADGIGIHLALKLFTDDGLCDNVNGTDLFPHLCKMAAREKLSLYLLGGQPGVATAVAEEAQKRVCDLEIAGTQHGYFDADDEQAIVRDINRSGADILLVAMGVPMQEKWIAANAAKLDVRVAMGVGGLFDFYSGRIARAPMWMREMGLEWAYRLLQEPGRMWRRYVVGNPVFLWRAWRWSRARELSDKRQTAHCQKFSGH